MVALAPRVAFRWYSDIASRRCYCSGSAITSEPSPWGSVWHASVEVPQSYLNGPDLFAFCEYVEQQIASHAPQFSRAPSPSEFPTTFTGKVELRLS